MRIAAPALGSDRVVLMLLGGLAVIGVGIVVWGLRPPPQMGPDEAVFRTVDALFTAITARDVQRLNDCAERLRGYHAEGRLPSAAAARLDGVIGTAKSGGWQSAAETLYDFMRGQRREGADVPRAKPVKTPARRRA
jgi:hypothetical protein